MRGAEGQEGERRVGTGGKRAQRFLSEELSEGARAHYDRIVASAREQMAKHLDAMRALDHPGGMEHFYGMADLFGPRAEELGRLKREGVRVVGTLCYFVPAELIRALGAVPIRLCSGIYEAVHPANDLLADAGLCPLVKSTLGLKMALASPLMELCDLLVVPTPCDAKLKLGEILQDLVEVHMMNLPAVKSTDAGRLGWLEELRGLQRALERALGRRLSRAQLKASIQTYQRAQAAWRRLTEVRKRGSIWGRDALLVAQLSFFDDIERWTDRVSGLAG